MPVILEAGEIKQLNVSLTPPVADIRLSDLVISPEVCYVGDTIEISVIATNHGMATGSRTIICTIT